MKFHAIPPQTKWGKRTRLPLLLKVPYSELLVYALKSLLELINASARINKLLLAGEEGMTL